VPDVGSNEGSQVVVPADDVAGAIKVECQQFAVDKKWVDASTCADRLSQHDAKTAKQLKAQYKQELENMLSKDKVDEAVNKKDLTRAKRELAAIEEGSVYREAGEKAVGQLEADLVARYRAEAIALKAKNKCTEIDRLVGDAREKGGPAAAAAVQANKCPAVVERDCSEKLLDKTRACKQQFCNKNPNDSACTTGATVVTPPANCDADALREKGMENVSMGQHAAALSQFEASLRCKRDSYVLQLAFMEACASGNSPKAKLYYKQLTPTQQQRFAQICIRQKPPVAYE
jgi:hypothetical protein